MRSPLDKLITFSFFENAFGKVPEVRQLTLRSLDDFVRAPFVATTPDIKEARLVLPLFKPARFEDGRKADNLVSIDCIEGDYDAGLKGLDWAVARLMDAGISAYVYSTSRHTDKHPRFRVICPLSRSLPPSEWERFFAFLNQVLEHSLDPGAANPSQGYFIGWLDVCQEPEICHVEGPGCDFIDLVLLKNSGSIEHHEGDTLQSREGEVDDDPFEGLVRNTPRQIADVRSMLSALSADEYGTWIRVGLILHHELGSAGFDIWDEWSARSQHYGGTETKWRTFAPPQNGMPVGTGSLRKMALAAGWSDPDTDPDIRRMNEKHALVMLRGKALVATFGTEEEVTFSHQKDLHAFYENDRVPVGNGKTEPVSKRWMRHPERRVYEKGITFAPGRNPSGRLNLWTGWKVEPDPAASCELYFEHLRDVLCGGDAILENYVLGWLAHLVQRPWEIPGVALVLRGEKGVGKDTFAEYLVPMMGRQHVPTVSQGEHVTGRFNARLEAALVLHIQEGIWGGDRKAEQVLKYLITSETIEIERKGIDSFSVPSCLRVIMTGNEGWMVPASAHERRFAVLDVSSSRQGDSKYFQALRREMTNGGPAALMHHLLNFDLSAFNVQQPPATRGLLDQKLRSLRGVEKWWYECLVAGEILPATSHSSFAVAETEWEAGLISMVKSEARERYSTYIRSRRHEGDPVDEGAFSKALLQILPGLRTERRRVEGGRPWQFVFPALEDCREQFSAQLGHEIEWPD